MALLNELISDGRNEKKMTSFPVVMVHYSKLVPSEANNYSVDNIRELANMVLLSGGIKQNLLVRKKTPDEYEVIAGHRRRLAVKYIVEELGHEEYSMVPVHVEKDGDLLSEVDLILTNCGARERSGWEKMMEVTRLTDLLKAMQTGTEIEQGRFRQLFGREPGLGGRELRKVIAETLGLSETAVANLNHINSKLDPELKEQFRDGKIGVSVANEAAGLSPEKQKELAGKDEIRLADVKQRHVSESDMGKKGSSKEIPCFEIEGQYACARAAHGTSEPESASGSQETVMSIVPTGEEPEPDQDNPDVIEAEFTEIPAEPVKIFDRRMLQELIDREQKTIDDLQEVWKSTQPWNYTKHVMMLQAFQNLMETGGKTKEVELVPVEQPKLPVLKNNDQRKEWLDMFHDWPVWFEVPYANEVYYRYDLPDGSSIIICEYRYFAEWKTKYRDENPECTGTREYLLNPGYHYLDDCKTNRSALIEKMKEIQKKGK